MALSLLSVIFAAHNMVELLGTGLSCTDTHQELSALKSVEAQQWQEEV